ncbi:anaphase-promoting complex subunit Cut9 [Elasticomyces elasticus]|nr:anaphase-promoting complex subunit Cut9 [Elasticomyces elasticus]
MEKFLRDWRQDALNKHQYESAIFVGDKLLALTKNDKDAFWLAQVHFSTGNYTRALGFLLRQDLITRSPSCKYLAAHCYVKQSRFDDALNILGDKNPVHLITTSDSSRRKLLHASSNGYSGSRSGPGKSKLGARDIRIDRSEEREHEDASNIRFEAAMCYLRGLCYAKQNSFDRAKTCYKDAVRIDVQCFEAFDQLMKNSLMSPKEEWEFLDTLNFDTVTPFSPDGQEAAEFTRILYVTRISKYTRAEEFDAAVETLSSHYNLASNPDILLAKAEGLYTHCDFRSALTLTSQILERDPHNVAIIPLHVAVLHALSEKNALFLIAHDLADSAPSEPSTWLAVGVYYLTLSQQGHSNASATSNKIPEARRYFSKASLMDPYFGPAWIGFAHTFALEGEHDQAISAYSTAARLFQGTHLPQLFLGMQNLCLSNFALAREYLSAAYELCKEDPLLLNEMGVLCYQEDRLPEAIRSFQLALELSSTFSPDSDLDTGADNAILTTKTNLAHALRRSGRYTEAVAFFDDILHFGGKDVDILATKGLVLLELDQPAEALAVLHQALAVNPQDPMATELLSRALSQLERTPAIGAEIEEEFAGVMGPKMREVLRDGGYRRSRRKNRTVEHERSSSIADVSGMDDG